MGLLIVAGRSQENKSGSKKRHNGNSCQKEWQRLPLPPHFSLAPHVHHLSLRKRIPKCPRSGSPPCARIIFLQSGLIHDAGRRSGAEVRPPASLVHDLPAEQVRDLRSVRKADRRRKTIQDGMVVIKVPAGGAGPHASHQSGFRTSDQAAIFGKSMRPLT